MRSYQLIHRQLSTDELTSFFKERTRVQTIDYGKICREMFLPKMSISEPIPSKQDLIAYTRLLQQGPAVRDHIWVLTKKGNIKESNQVFLGADYSPVEDWEKHGRYSPQMDFLSNDYLRSGNVADWKEFFGNVGVKNKADNPYVESFAVAYTEDKLATELKNFVPKDRQHQGYDREAQRVTDNSLVYVEIKGQKAEHVVELRGNEPRAAKLAGQQGGMFWLCVVAGIPENPELWVVEDVLKAGDYDTLTIDVREWKLYGRRVY